MKHILTVTFNPAIDKNITVEKLIPEYKMKTSEPVYQPGGGGVNVSRALKKLGYASTAVYCEGGDSGRFFSELLAEEQVETIAITIQNPTRENFIVYELQTHRQYRFGLPGPEISAAEVDLLLSTVEKMEYIDFLVVSGSIPHSIPLDIFQRLKEIAVLKTARLVVDTSGASLKRALESGVFLIKPSISEMAVLAGKKVIDVQQAIETAKQIIFSGQCEVIIISLGGEGAVLVTKELVLKLGAPNIPVVSTVGAGDSMLAGILFRLAHGDDYHSVLKYGIACGSAATQNPGTGLCDKKTADQFFRHNHTT